MSNIGKRWAKPSIWDKPDFSKWSLKKRLFWFYLNNRCDLAGVHQLHFPVDTAFLGFKVDQPFIESFLEAVNTDAERVKPIGSQRLWLTNFVRYQQTGKNKDCLSAKSPPHKSVVAQLKEHGILELAFEDDPELYREFTAKIPEPPTDEINTDSKGKTTLSQDYPNPYSNGSGNNNGSSSDSGSDKGVHANNSLKASNGKASSTIYERVQDNIGSLALNEIGSLTFEKDVDNLLKELRDSEVNDPEDYLIQQLKKTDWTETSWKDFKNQIFDVAETPF
jgi:hypothetical protein